MISNQNIIITMVKLVKTNEQMTRTFCNGESTEKIISADFVIRKDDVEVGNAHVWCGGFSFSINDDRDVPAAELVLKKFVEQM